MIKELSEGAIEARRKYNRDYMRNWRKRPGNQDKQKEYDRKRWERQSVKK